MAFDYSVIQPLVEKLLWMVGLMLVDVIAGAMTAIFVTKNFQWEKLPSFLIKYVPYIFGWLVFVFFQAMPAEFSKSVLNGLSATETIVYLGIMAGVGASILAKLGQLGVLSEPLSRIGIGDGSNIKGKG